jgi:hypothetical protein
MLFVQALVLIASGDMGRGIEPLAQNLNGHVGVCDEVVIPGRMGGRATLRRDDHVVVAVARVHERVLAFLVRSGALRGQYQYVPAQKRS